MWEELISSIDKAISHAKAIECYRRSSGASGMSASMASSMYGQESAGNIAVKIEPVDINAIGAGNGFQGVCHYCKTQGHRVSECEILRVKNKKRDNESKQPAKTGSSRQFDSSKQYSSNDSSYRSNKPRENSERYKNQSGRRNDGSTHKKVNNLELCDESFDEEQDY